jgi:hypothetical protein
MPLYPTPRPLSDPLVLERALSDLLETDWTVVQPASGLPAKKAFSTDPERFLSGE